jgi:hypothetical protein
VGRAAVRQMISAKIAVEIFRMFYCLRWHVSRRRITRASAEPNKVSPSRSILLKLLNDWNDRNTFSSLGLSLDNLGASNLEGS